MLGKRARPIRRTTSMSQLRPAASSGAATELLVQEQRYPAPSLCTRFNHPSGFVPHYAPEGPMNGMDKGSVAVTNPVALQVHHASSPVTTYNGSAWTESMAQNDSKNVLQDLPIVLSQELAEPGAGRSNAHVAIIGEREGEFQRCAGGNIDHRYVSDCQELQQYQNLIASLPTAVLTNRIEHRPSLISPVGFLDMCFYCRRRLSDGQDIYMYRGDAAFCSVDCRQLQIAIDERKRKCSMVAAINKEISATSPRASDHNKVVPRRTEEAMA